MDIESLWNKFASSGSISDYLRYFDAREMLNDNN